MDEAEAGIRIDLGHVVMRGPVSNPCRLRFGLGRSELTYRDQWAGLSLRSAMLHFAYFTSGFPTARFTSPNIVGSCLNLAGHPSQ